MNAKSPVFDKAVSSDSMGSVGETHQYSDRGTFKGKVRVYVEEDGKESVVWEDPNLIVDLGRKVLTHLLAEADSNFKVSSIGLGTKGHDLINNDILVPIAPTVSDIGLIDVDTIFTKDISTSFAYQGTNPVDNAVQFQIVLEKTEANGATGTTAYTEAGLFTSNGSLFARETFPAIVKNANRRITFQWIILF